MYFVNIIDANYKRSAYKGMKMTIVIDDKIQTLRYLSDCNVWGNNFPITHSDRIYIFPVTDGLCKKSTVMLPLVFGVKPQPRII